MAISYPVNVPNLSSIAGITLTRQNVVGVTASPFTLTEQTFQHQGQRWLATVELHPLSRSSVEEWRAFLASLMGAHGTFLMGDPMCAVPRGSAAGTPKTRTQSQSGNELDIYAATTSVNSWLLAGDYIQIGSASTAHMHRVLQIVTTNASGAAVLEIWPRIRTSPSSGEAIYVNSAQSVWRLTPDSEAEVLMPPNNIALSFSAQEAL